MKLRVPSFKVAVISAVIVSFLLSAASNFLVYQNGKEVAENSKDDSARLACNSLYNELSGKARDERSGFAKLQTKADLRVWQKLKAQTTDPNGTDAEQLARFLKTIQDKIDSLKSVLNSQAENPYPDPNACRDSVITEEEGNLPK